MTAELVLNGKPQIRRGVSPRKITSPGASPRVALIFDDGYRSNLEAAKIMARFGFAATVSIEIDQIGQNYNADAAYPVLNADDLRTLINVYGWEVCNHPNLDTEASESTMASEASAENTLLREILEGSKAWDGSSFAATGSTPYPEFSSFETTSAVYRGGGRNQTSDNAYDTVFDRYRTINGSIDTRGNALRRLNAEGPKQALWTGQSVDTNGDDSVLLDSIAYVQSFQAGEFGIIYAHDTPSSSSGAGGGISVPYIHLDHLEQLCQAAYDAGVLIVPWRDLGVCNLVPDNKFSNTNSHTLTAASGDTVQYTDSVVLNSMPRSVQLTATANQSSISATRIRTNDFAVQPFTEYHITVAYRIDTELSRLSASNLWGLAAVWSTTQFNTEKSSAGVQNDYDNNQRTGYTRPYQVTSGWARQTYTFYTGYAFGANIQFSLYNCTGTAYIGHIKVEKGRYFGQTGLRGSSTYNGASARRIYLLPPNTAVDDYGWGWQVEILHDTDPADPAIVTDAGNGGTFDITTDGGTRTDAFTWIARPIQGE